MIGAERLTKAYGDRLVLGPITLDLAPGTLTAVIGRSGCGKSTLLRCLAGLEAPSGGRVALEADAAVPGYVFQEPRLMPWLSVRRNVGFGLKRGRASEAAVNEALEVVGLADAADLLPKQLSGGMAQRAGLARALAARPALLLLDEPFSALDPLKRGEMQAHLQAIRQHYDPTMVLITHDMDEALVLADRVLVMHGPPGRIVADIAVELPGGRDRTEPAFQAHRRRLMEWLSDGDAAAA